MSKLTELQNLVSKRRESISGTLSGLLAPVCGKFDNHMQQGSCSALGFALTWLCIGLRYAL